MKQIAVALLFVAATSAVMAQTNANVLRQLDFSLDEIEKMEDIQEAAVEVMEPAQAQVDVIKQKLTRLLLKEDVDLGEVEQLLRQSLQWELKIRMAVITQQVEIRRIVGDQRWAVMLRAAHLLQNPESAGRIENSPFGESLSDNPNMRARLLNLLRHLNRG
jgi:hypothetical protein